jgi:hypothetical protein
MSEGQRITACKTAMGQIYTMLRSSPQQWPEILTLARTVISHLDSTTFMQQATRTTEQVLIIAALQTLALKDFDSGATMDLYSWCSRQWLVILQRDAQNLAALRGLGQMWLSRAQPALARIHTSHNKRSAASSVTEPSTRSRVESNSEAERRVGTADYVEARGFLQPATEYLERSVTAAKAQSTLSGDLLAKVSLKLSMVPEEVLITSRQRRPTCLLVTSQAYVRMSDTTVVRCNCCEKRRRFPGSRFHHICRSESFRHGDETLTRADNVIDIWTTTASSLSDTIPFSNGFVGIIVERQYQICP